MPANNPNPIFHLYNYKANTNGLKYLPEIQCFFTFETTPTMKGTWTPTSDFTQTKTFGDMAIT
jgi:hypothetical protein